MPVPLVVPRLNIFKLESRTPQPSMGLVPPTGNYGSNTVIDVTIDFVFELKRMCNGQRHMHNSFGRIIYRVPSLTKTTVTFIVDRS